MPTFIGLDGYPGGWVAVYIDGRAQRFHFASTAEQLLGSPHDRAMIDIPIGLPERGYRLCDIAAKQIIHSSAFLGARWNVWNFPSYANANAYYRNENDHCISQQLWQLRTKLCELNVTMTPKKQGCLQETHPELVFWRLNGKRRLDAKKTAAGRARRVELLKENGINRIDEWLAQRHGTGIRRDDLIDACACAVAARDSKDRLPIGEVPTTRGIRMEIWY